MPTIMFDRGKGCSLVSKDLADSSFLMHYRVGGEKKGVRRWQNKDGSYTSEGYQHYAQMYGWGKNKRSRQQSLDAAANGKAEIRKLDKAEYEAYANSQFKLGRELDAKSRKIWDETERKLNKYGITSSEGKFSNNAYAATEDKKAQMQVIKAIDKIPRDVKEPIVKEANAVFDRTRYCDQVYDTYSSKYAEEHGGEFDGDGGEFHELLCKTYPEYKKEYALLDKQISRFVQDVVHLTNTRPELQNLKLPHKYMDYFEEIVDSDDNPWYKMGHISAFMLASQMTDTTYIYPEMFVEYVDKNGKDLGNPILMAMEDEK